MISICTYNLPGHFSELWRTHCSVSHKGNCWCHRSGKETEDHWPSGHRGGQHWLQWGHQKGNHSHEVREHNNHEYLGLFSRVVSCVLLKIIYRFPKTIILATAHKCTFSAGILRPLDLIAKNWSKFNLWSTLLCVSKCLIWPLII